MEDAANRQEAAERRQALEQDAASKMEAWLPHFAVVEWKETHVMRPRRECR